MDTQKKDYTLEEYKAIRNKIDDILLDFDFDKVADVMEHLDWTWYDSSFDGKIPSSKELREKAYYLLINSVYAEDSTSSGGFEVACGKPLVEWDDDTQEYEVDLSLKFVVESV